MQDGIRFAAGDLNGDGKADLVVGGGPSVGMAAYLNKGDGSFPEAPIMTPNGDYNVVLGDFDGDQKLDLIADYLHGPHLFLGAGDGTFGRPTDLMFEARYEGYLNLVTADFNGDHNLDIALEGQNQFGVALNPGGGAPFAGTVDYMMNNNDGLAVGDFNGDGKPDLVVGNARNRTLVIYLNDGNGNFSPDTAKEYPVVSAGASGGSDPYFISAGDFNGDGKDDIVFACEAASFGSACLNSFDVLLNKGDGTLGPAHTFPLGEDYPDAVVAADLNHDGKADIGVLAGKGYNAQVRTYMSNGDGTFGATPLRFAVSGNVDQLVAVDFLGTGQLGLAAFAFDQQSKKGTVTFALPACH
jgi:hypothetical protein